MELMKHCCVHMQLIVDLHVEIPCIKGKAQRLQTQHHYKESRAAISHPLRITGPFPLKHLQKA